MTRTSPPTPASAPAMTMRASLGSMGRTESFRPVGVTLIVPDFSVSRAPSSVSSVRPSRTALASGGVRNGKPRISSSLEANPRSAIWRMTLARLVRRISGSVNSGRDAKSASE